MTKHLAFGLLALAACSDEADIGVDSSPVQCAQTAVAQVAGSVEDPGSGTDYNFDAATPTVAGATGGAVATLSGDIERPDTQGRLLLRFVFRCGPAEIAKYGVIGDGQTQQLHCPYEVPTAMLGQIEYLPADAGVLYVDQTSDCLAGRFRVDFGAHGAVGGWFSVPWQ